MQSEYNLCDESRLEINCIKPSSRNPCFPLRMCHWLLTLSAKTCFLNEPQPANELPSCGLCGCTKISKSKDRIMCSIWRSEVEGLKAILHLPSQDHNLAGAVLNLAGPQWGQPVSQHTAGPALLVSGNDTYFPGLRLHYSAIKLGGVGKCLLVIP